MKQSLKLQKEYWKIDDQILVQNIILLSLYGNSITCIFVAGLTVQPEAISSKNDSLKYVIMIRFNTLWTKFFFLSFFGT